MGGLRVPVGGFAADHDPDRRPADGAHQLDEKHRRDPGTPHGGQGPPPLGTGNKGEALLPHRGPGGRGGPGDPGLPAQSLRGQRGAAGEHHGGAGGAEPGGDRPALRGPAEAGGKGP